MNQINNNIYPIVNILTNSSDISSNLFEELVYEFPYKCDQFQLHAFESIHKGNDVLVCAPTGSGKTTVIQYAIIYTILKKNKRAVLTVPIKVLANQSYADLLKILTDLGITVGISTGDIKINDDAQFVVMTAEILRNSMYQLDYVEAETIETNSKKRMSREFVESIGCIISDETHYANDKERGHVWEETIILANQHTQLVMTSATINQPEKFAKWISRCHKKQVDLITVSERKVPLRHYLLINNCLADNLESPKRLYEIMDKKNTFLISGFADAKYAHEKWIKERQKKSKPINDPNNIQQVIRWLKDNNGLLALVFSFSQKQCEDYAESIDFDLVTHEERHQIEQIFNNIMLKENNLYIGIPQAEKVKRLLLKGIAFHHAGLLPILKETIELIFKEGLGKVLFCTETYAVGVNLPAKTVVISSTEKYTKEGLILIPPEVYIQIAGRAGRRGLDENGTVIILFKEKFPNETDMKRILSGKIPSIESHLKLDYQFILRATLSNITNVEEFYSKSLANEFDANILNGLMEELHYLNTELEQLKLLNTVAKSNKEIQSLIKYQNQTSNNQFGIKINLPKKQQKEYDNLIKKLSNDKTFKELYDNANKLEILKSNILKINNQIDYYSNLIVIKSNGLKQLLYDWNYIISENYNTTLLRTDVNVKGQIAGIINECNPILLTELICNQIYLTDLTIQEIISFVSLFVTPIKKVNNDVDTNDFDNFVGTPKLKIKIANFINMIKQKILDEDNVLGVGHSQTDWSVTTDYVDLSLNWANGTTTKEILEQVIELNEREGNFVKNMIKIDNIICDIISACKIIKNIELLPILEQATPLIIRDIVTVSSINLK